MKNMTIFSWAEKNVWCKLSEESKKSLGFFWGGGKGGACLSRVGHTAQFNNDGSSRKDAVSDLGTMNSPRVLLVPQGAFIFTGGACVIPGGVFILLNDIFQ